MKNASKFSEIIQKYLTEELSEAEKVEFKKLINSDPELQDEIRLYRKVNSAISDLSLENFKKELELIHQQNFGSRISRFNLNNKQWYLAAALILVLLTIGYLFQFQSKSNVSQDVFNKFYKPFEVSILRGIDVEADKYTQAVDLYNNGHYILAFPRFEKIIAENGDNYAARLYLGICAIELNDFVTAKEQLNAIIKSKDVFYIQDAKWYLALTSLKMGEKHKAVSYFKKIKKDGRVYAERASLVLDELQ